MIERVRVPVTTDASGDATVLSRRITGFVHQINYIKTDFATGVDFTITVESNAQSLWTQVDQNASATKAPRQPTHDGVGAASLYAAAGEGVEDRIALGNDRVKIVVAQGGNATTGTFDILVDK